MGEPTEGAGVVRRGDRVRVRLGSPGLSPVSWVRGTVVRAPHEPREGVSVTVDCDDGWRRYVDPTRIVRVVC